MRTCPSEQAGEILEASTLAHKTNHKALSFGGLVTSEVGSGVKLSHISPVGYVQSAWTLGRM